MKKIVFIVLLLFFGFTLKSQIVRAAENSIANADLEVVSPTSSRLAKDWQTGQYGNNKVIFSYPVAGQDNSKAIKVEITQYKSGDAKWYFNELAVLPGQQYLFGNYYKANVASEIIVQFRLANGKYQYVDLVAPKKSVAWRYISTNINVPKNAVAMTVFHVINQVGWLVTDNYSLTYVSGPQPSPTPTLTPSVTPTQPPTSSPSPTISVIPTATPTVQPTVPVTPTSTPTPSPTLTPTPTMSPTQPPTPTALPTLSPTQPPSEPSPTISNQPTPGPSSPTPTETLPSVTQPTSEPSPSLSLTPNPSVTEPTDSVTATPSQVISPTPSPTATATPTQTPVPTVTPTGEPSPIPSVTQPSLTPTSPPVTISPTSEPTGVPSLTETPTVTPTLEPSLSPAITLTATPTPTMTPTPTPTDTPRQNLVLNGNLDDQSGNQPQSWYQGNWGTNLALFQYPVAGRTGNAAKVQMSNYVDGDAKWYFADVPVTPGQNVTFQDYYQADVPTSLVARFQDAQNNFSYTYLAELPASASWQATTLAITVPMGASSMTVFHLIQQNGSLQIDDVSLELQPASPAFTEAMVSLDFDDGWLSVYQNALPILNAAGLKSTQYIIADYLAGDDWYMSQAQILEMQSQGHEIASHTRSHPHLPELTSEQKQEEIAGSLQILQAAGLSPIRVLAYPYGEFTADVIQKTVAAGYQGGRTALASDGGYNDPTTDPYRLKTQSVELNTSLDEIKGWIDTARQSKTWLILVFHQVDNNGGLYSIPPARLQEVVNYLKDTHIKVVTASQGLAQMATP